MQPPGFQQKHLPLGLLGGQKVIKNLDKLLQTSQPITKLILNSSLIVTKLCVKVLAVGCSAHGGTEDGLDHETVVLGECVSVAGAEGCAEFFVGVGEVLAEGLGGEIEAAVGGWVLVVWVA